MQEEHPGGVRAQIPKQAWVSWESRASGEAVETKAWVPATESTG